MTRPLFFAVSLALGIAPLAGSASAQQAPLAIPNVLHATVAVKRTASHTERNAATYAARALLAKGIIQNGARLTRSAVISGAAQADGGNNGSNGDGGDQSGTQVGGSTSNNSGKSGGGIVPTYQLVGRGYGILFGINATSTRSIGNNSSGGTTGSTSSAASTLGSALLNPGSNTQSINVIFLKDLWRRDDIPGDSTAVTKPDAPINLKVVPNVGEILVNWQAPAGADTYNLYRKVEGDADYKLYKQGLTGTAYSDKGATDAEKNYYYQSTAVNAKGESDRSNEASAKPKKPSPGGGAGTPGTPVAAQAADAQAISVVDATTAQAIANNRSGLARAFSTEFRKALERRSGSIGLDSNVTAQDAHRDPIAQALADPDTGEQADLITVTISSSRLGLFVRAGVSFMDVSGTDPSATAGSNSSLTVSGQVFAPAVGFQYLLGGLANNKNVSAGIEVGYTWRFLSGDIGAASNQTFLATNFGPANTTSFRTRYGGPEVTLFAATGLGSSSARPYIRWNNFNGNGLPGFSGGQWTIGMDIFTRLF